MTEDTTPHPAVVSQAEWLEQRKALLAKEKELTKHYDSVSAERRRLPMVMLEKEYHFDTADGKRSLTDLFEGQRQLIVYHFMFDPDWDQGCDGCTSFVDALGKLSSLADRNTTFVLVSRAPLAKIDAYKKLKGWDRTWVSSYGSDFNYDFHATLDSSVAPIAYNFCSEAELIATGHAGQAEPGEQHGLSVFFRWDGAVYHTYSTYARGVESLTDSYALLDVTPYGRQEDWEDSPTGWPQQPTYG